MPEMTFALPDLGEGLEDAEIVRWLVSEGDEVSLNQPIVEADTAKALVEIPSPFEGRVARLHAAEGDTVEVGAALVTFEVTEEAEAGRKAVLVGYGVEEETSPKRRRRLRQGAAAAPDREGKPLAPPPVRRLAKEMGVELSEVSGTGPGGRITRDDVMAAAREAPGGPVVTDDDIERVPVKGVRRLVAEKMSRSVREIPHVTTFLTVDATAIDEARDRAASSTGTKISPLAVVARAFVEIVNKHPKLNASFDAEAGEILIHRSVHLGVATDTERGLIVPVIRDAHRMDTTGMASEIARLSEAARAGKATPEDLTGSTVTISNVGSFGAEYGTPIINHPEAAILALGIVQVRPAVLDGEIVARPQVVLSLSFDHRLLDGAEAGRALKDLKSLLEDPEALAAL